MMAVAVFLHNQLQRKKAKEGGAVVRVGMGRIGVSWRGGDKPSSGWN